MGNESDVVGDEASGSKPRASLCFPLWPLLDTDTLGGRTSARDLLEILELALPNFSPSALRIFDEWVAPFERRFDDTFRPLACTISGSVLTLKLEHACELLVDTPSKLAISREVFRIGHARSVRLNGTSMPGKPGSAPGFIEYEHAGDVVTRRAGVSSRSFPYNLETAAVEFVTG
ncbi:MAG TPA: hypothetical protein VFZ53_30930 [Polyangiaceae bacterium]